MSELLPGQVDAIAASNQAAAESLVHLQKLLTAAKPDNPPGPLTLGKPLTVSTISLGELQRVNPPKPDASTGPAFETLRKKPATVVYPVLDQNAVIGAEIVISRRKDIWKRAEMGNPSLVTRVERVIRIPGVLPEDAIPAVLSVPDLNHDFVMTVDQQKPKYVPLTDDPYLGFSTKQRLTANELLTLLIKAAKAHDGLPR